MSTHLCLHRGLLLAAVMAAPLLSACAWDAPSNSPAATAPISGANTQSLVGRWGVGAYRREEDQGRTEREARAQCRNPYVIKPAASGGVMMHLADEKEPFELRVRRDANGRTILGPEGAPDSYNDREIVAFDEKSFTTRWIDGELAERFGVTIYVRCGASAAPTKARRA